jgi:hypothetical protein
MQRNIAKLVTKNNSPIAITRKMLKVFFVSISAFFGCRGNNLERKEQKMRRKKKATHTENRVAHH